MMEGGAVLVAPRALEAGRMSITPRKVIAALTAGWLVLLASPAIAVADETAPPDESAAAPAPSATAEQVATWIVASGDNQGLPFVIVDKASASVAVYGADGGFRAAAPVLLGSAVGDESVPGIGDRPLSAILPEERTTPAGRFVAGYGPAAGGRNVLWVDFGAAISIHAVIVTNRKERRLERLNSPQIDDNRITYGCINVPAAFYEDVVRQTFTGTKGVVYVLPEVRMMAEVFPTMHLQLEALAAEERKVVAIEAP
jgi:hypothetical protein